jgi:hypothetical protein
VAVDVAVFVGWTDGGVSFVWVCLASLRVSFGLLVVWSPFKDIVKYVLFFVCMCENTSSSGRREYRDCRYCRGRTRRVPLKYYCTSDSKMHAAGELAGLGDSERDKRARLCPPHMLAALRLTIDSLAKLLCKRPDRNSERCYVNISPYMGVL